MFTSFKSKKIQDYKKLELFAFLMIGLLLIFTQNFAQEVPGPSVDWRRYDWVKKNPVILNSAASELEFNRDNSGSDWWYDIKYSYNGGSNPYGFPISGTPQEKHNGYILSGYSSINNFDGVDPGQSCYFKQDLPYSCQSLFEEGVGSNDEEDDGEYKTQFYHTMAKLSVDGKNLEWFKVLPFNANCYRTIQLKDGSYIGIGDTYSIYDFNGNPMPYNKGETATNNYFCNGQGSVYPPLDKGSENCKLNQEYLNARMWRLIGVSKISSSGEVLWTNLYGYESYDQLHSISIANENCLPCFDGTNGAPLQNPSDPSDPRCIEKNKFDNEPWDVVQSIQNDYIFVGGRRNKYEANNAIVLKIDPNSGNLVSKGIIDVAPLTPYGYPISSTVKALSINISDGQEEVIAGITSGFFNGNNSNNARITLTSVRSDCLSCVPNWSHRIPQTFPNNPDQKTQQNINSITKISGTDYFAAGVLLNCLDCTSSGSNSGEISAIKFNSNGIVAQTNLGIGGAYDFRVGICNNVFSNDGSISLTSAKHPTPVPVSRGTFICPNTMSAIGGTKPYYDTDTYIAKLDNNLNLISGGTIPDSYDQLGPQVYPQNWRNQECMYSIVETPDFGVISAGNQSNNLDDNYLVKAFFPCASISDFDIVGIGPVHPFWGSTPYETRNEYWIGNNENNVIWNSSKKVFGTVVIHEGSRLTIEGNQTVIEFSDHYNTTNDASKIIVLPGGQLIIRNGAKITSMENCKNSMWGGIEVWGNSNQPQLTPLNTPSYQGSVVISNGAIIENAFCGIRSGSELEINNIEWGTVNKGGGIISADDAIFLNNLVDVDISWYRNSTNFINESPNRSYLNKCSFITNRPLRRSIKDKNPIYLTNEIVEEYQSSNYTKAHVNLSNVNGISITGCNFKNELSSTINGETPCFTAGINAFEAGFSLNPADDNTPNTFENLLYGVRSGAYHGQGGGLPQSIYINSPLININNCNFTNCMRGVQLDATMLSKVNRNTFEIHNKLFSPQINGIYPRPVAIYTNGALGFDISDNTVNTSINSDAVNYGIVNNNSLTGAGRVYKNQVNNQYFKQYFFGNNLSLKANCNEYNNSDFGNADWVVLNSLMNQGTCNASGQVSDPTKPRANYFSQVQLNPAVPNYQIALAPWGTTPFEYNSYSDNLLLPTHYSAGALVLGCGEISSFNYALACPSVDYTLDEYNYRIAKYDNAFINWFNVKKLIDNNQTYKLLDSLELGNFSVVFGLQQNTKKLLSDPVLCQMLNHLPPSDWNEFANIMIANSPFSNKVSDCFNNAPMPSAVHQSIVLAQNGVSARNIVENQLKQLEYEKDFALNDLVFAYLDSTSINEAYDLLKADPGVNAKLLGINFFKGQNQQIFKTQLSTILDSLINFERDTNSYKSLKELSNYYLNILPKTDSILSNKNFNFSIFKDLKGQETIQGINSAVVLAASGREDYIYNPPNFNIQTDAYRLENNSVDGVSKSTNKTIENPKTIVLTKPYKLYPNPSNGLITIEFMDDEKNSNFELLEISGKLLEKKYLNNVVNELDFSKLNNGIYFLRITQSNEKQFVDKIIIAK